MEYNRFPLSIRVIELLFAALLSSAILFLLSTAFMLLARAPLPLAILWGFVVACAPVIIVVGILFRFLIRRGAWFLEGVFNVDLDGDSFVGEPGHPPILLRPRRELPEIVVGYNGSVPADDIIAFLEEVDRRQQQKRPYGQRNLRGLPMPSGQYPNGLGDALYDRIVSILTNLNLWVPGKPGRPLHPLAYAINVVRQASVPPPAIPPR